MVPTAPFVIPAKAGIRALTSRERTPTAIRPPTPTRRPHFVFPAKAPSNPDTAPESRGVGRVRPPDDGKNRPASHDFHSLGTKMTLVRKWTGQVASHSTLAASLRGSDRSIRHSREGGNPRTNIPRKNANCDTTTYAHTATPLRLSGESTLEPRYGAGIQRGWGG